MRFDGGINLLFHFGFALSNPDFLTGKLFLARGIRFLLIRPKNVNVFFFF